MPTAILPLQDLAQHITQYEAELNRLRKEYASRQTQLKHLTRRKQELESQLQKVDKELQAVNHNRLPAPTQTTKPTLVPAKQEKTTVRTSASKNQKGVFLPQLLVDILQQAKRALTIKELTEAAIRRKYQTKSTNLQAIVETRTHELVKDGLLQRASDRSGFELAGSPKSKTAPTKPVTSHPLNGATSNGPKKVATTKKVGSANNLTLKEAVTLVLSKSTRPLSAQELADKVVASGYVTQSKDFKTVIWVGVGKMENVERIPDQGYRLKKGKVTVNKKK